MKILAIDISSLFSRNWEVADGKDFSEPYNRTVQAVARYREGHDRVALCCDAGPSFRKSIWPEYKANRTDRGEPYREQLRRTIERLVKDGCAVFRGMPLEAHGGGFAEADDVIGSLCAWALEGGHTVTVLSGDKDLLQCVCDGVSAISLNDGKVYMTSEVVEKFGVLPSMIPDFLALAGDTSDNYKPFEGVAAGGALKILKAFGGSALAMYEPANMERLAEVVGPSVAAKIKAHPVERVTKALQVATVLRDLPIDFSPLLEEPKLEPLTEPQVIDAPAAKPEPTQIAMRDPAATAQIVRAPRSDPWGLQPTESQSLVMLAKAFVEARCFPNVGNQEQVMVVAIMAQNMGVPMGVAMNHAYFVRGRLSWSASFIVALVRRSAECEQFYISESKPESATVTYKRRGEPQGRYVFTLEMAKKAGWVKSGGQWADRPDVMCRWAAQRECARMVWPDLVAGVYMPDEIADGSVPDEQWKQDTR